MGCLHSSYFARGSFVNAAIEFMLALMGVYLLIGCMAAPGLHLYLAKHDPGVAGAGWMFRAIITPGLIALWPFMAWRIRAGTAQPHPEAWTSSRRLRGAHKHLTRALAVAIPLVAAVALGTRTPEPTVPAGALPSFEQAPFPKVERVAVLSEELKVRATFRSNEKGEEQIELETAAPLAAPSVMLYWFEGASKPNSPVTDSILIGAVWGPGVQRYRLPKGATNTRGTFVLYSLGRAETIALSVQGG